MNTIQPIAELLPDVMRHLTERTTVNQLEAPAPTDVEAENGLRTIAEMRNHPGHTTADPDCSLCYEDSLAGNPYVDPDRAAHEISPDGWHASVGVASSNCPWCNDGTGGSNARGGEGGMQR